MPRRDIWIRVEDLKTWESIHDKPLFLHNAIALYDGYKELSPVQRKEVKEHIKKIPNKPDAYILSPRVAYDNPELVEQFDKLAERVKKGPIEFLCKVHSIPLDSRGKCLQKGCKYA